jgi:glycosyltransferase involved in cell wall biosynthesis
MSSNPVGTVVIGRNEGERLIRCLSSIVLEMQCVVYVDSGSTDDSIAAAERLGIIVIRLDMTRPFTAGRARNEGFDALRTLQPEVQYVQFIDGDCELVHGWIEAASTFIDQRIDVAVVCGRRRERYPELSVYNHLCDLEWNTPIGEALSCGGDSLMRVDAFAAVGGFRPQLIAGEEPELCLRLRNNGWKIWRLDQEMTRHDAAMTRFSQWWTRAVRSGYGCADVSWFHRASIANVYRRETISAILWGGILPLAIALGAFIYPAVLGVAVIYPVQVCRIAFKRGPMKSESWIYASFMMLAKFAAFYGILKFFWRRRTNRSIKLIEYK